MTKLKNIILKMKFLMSRWLKKQGIDKTWLINFFLGNRFGLWVLHQIFRLRYFFSRPSRLKLHLGCGTIHKKGFINIDHRWTVATDKIFDISRLPYLDRSATRIESYHVIEHLPHVDVDRVLSEWWRVLLPGGVLVLECPDFDATVREYLAGNQERIYNVYGLQRFKGDFHLYGYNEKRLGERLRRNGFTALKFTEPQDYHKDLEPCLRVEAHKQG